MDHVGYTTTFTIRTAGLSHISETHNHVADDVKCPYSIGNNMKVLISGSVWRWGSFGDQCMAYGLLPNRDQYGASPPGLSYLLATCRASTHMEIRMTLRSSSTGILPKK